MDAVLCSSHGTADAVSYINEVYRLLEPGGVFQLISLGQPHARLTALKCQAAASHVSTALPYPSAELQQRAATSAAATAAAKRLCQQQGQWCGRQQRAAVGVGISGGVPAAEA
jgi:cyclopropane fatty-acyl-phospholipid synthase-like methyltransferase